MKGRIDERENQLKSGMAVLNPRFSLYASLELCSVNLTKGSDRIDHPHFGC